MQSGRIWCEVFTADGSTRLGLISPVSVSVERRLDGIGTIDIVVPSADLHAAELLQIKRRVHLYRASPTRQLIVRGVLMRPSWRPGQETSMTTWECSDELGDLRDINTLRGWYFEEIAAARIARQLVDRVAGWHIKVEAGLDSIITTQRFDAVSIFKALIRLIETTGLHMRLGPDGAARWVSIGTFGEHSGIRITNLKAALPTENYSSVALIDRIEIMQDGNTIVNWIEPLGGNGEFPLTLRRASKNSPYKIETTSGPDGRTVYYLKDDASIARYGMVQRVLPLSGAVPVSVDTINLRSAANVVYDWGVTQLQKTKDPQWVYRISGVKQDKKILPGQQVRLAYMGYAYVGALPVKYVNVDTDVYVTKIREMYDEDGVKVDWEISNVNAIYESVAEIIAKAIRTQSDLILSTQLQQKPVVYKKTAVISNDIIYTDNLCVAGSSESSTDDGSNLPANAFDGDPATDWVSARLDTTHTIAYRVVMPQTVKKYSIRASATRYTQAPISWTLKYYDQTSAQMLVADERSGDPAWSAGEERTYEVAEDFTSTKWQLDIRTYGPEHYVAVAEIKMYAIASGPIDLEITIPEYVVDLSRMDLYVTREDVNGPQAFSVLLATEDILDGPWEIPGAPFLETPDDGATFKVDLQDISPVIAGNHTVTVRCSSGIGTVKVELKTIEATIAIM